MIPLLPFNDIQVRLWGWRENEVEQARASSEDPKSIPGYGESELTPYMQGVAHRNSAWSQLKFSTIPWFNVVNHKYHEPAQTGGTEESE